MRDAFKQANSNIDRKLEERSRNAQARIDDLNRNLRKDKMAVLRSAARTIAHELKSHPYTVELLQSLRPAGSTHTDGKKYPSLSELTGKYGEEFVNLLASDAKIITVFDNEPLLTDLGEYVLGMLEKPKRPSVPARTGAKEPAQAAP